MNNEELARYSRHILLDGFDVEGQAALNASHVLIVGAGGLGCPAAMYLASSGVGTLTLVDDDEVELSNLQRQIGHGTGDLAKLKVKSLKETLQSLNPSVEINTYAERLSDKNAQALIQSADLVLDCTDNFATRFLLNSLCQQLNVPAIIGAAQGMEGQVLVFSHKPASPCYECVFVNSGQTEGVTCENSGVLAPVVGVVGSYQALLACKLLAGYGKSDVNTLKTFDFYQSEWRSFTITQELSCPVCFHCKTDK